MPPAAGRRCHSGGSVHETIHFISGLPEGNSIELIAWLQLHCPQVTCVVISARGDEDTLLGSAHADVIDSPLMEREDAELLQSLQGIRRRGMPIDPDIARHILALLKLSSEPTATATPGIEAEQRSNHALSDRESAILKLVARGYSNREIAELTALSRFTIEGYTKSIYRKLAVRSRTAAVFEAKAMGLLH
jgi:DNA-binding NarL/FixJ family response regulator